MGFGINVALAGSGGSSGFHLFGDGLGKLRRQGVRLVKIAVVTLGPDVGVGGSVDQLHRHVDAVCGTHDGAFEDAVDAELARDVGSAGGWIFEGQEERIHMSEKVAPVVIDKDGNPKPASQAVQRLAREIVERSGANSVEHFNRVVFGEVSFRIRPKSICVGQVVGIGSELRTWSASKGR